jgi:hypothetical protein
MTLAAVPALATPITITVQLLPSLEVAPVSSEAFGLADITLDPENPNDGISFGITLNNITTPLLAAHIHLAPAGQNGPVAAQLFSFCAGSTCDGNEVSIFGDNIVIEGPGVLVAPDWQTVIGAILSGVAYVNVHSELAPAGEVRGNFIPEASTSTLFGLGLLGLTLAGGPRE